MTRGGPSYEAGIRPGDVIVVINGKDLTDDLQWVRAVADAQIGSTLTVTAIREGKKVEFRVAVQAMGATPSQTQRRR